MLAGHGQCGCASGELWIQRPRAYQTCSKPCQNASPRRMKPRRSMTAREPRAPRRPPPATRGGAARCAAPAGSRRLRSSRRRRRCPPPGRVERVGAAHLLADEVAHGRGLHLRHLEQELVVHLENEPRGAALLRSRRWMETIAALITSAAVPCMTKLTASRSPNPRVWRFRAFSSGTGRRRPRRRRVPVALGLLDRPLDEVLDVREAREYVSM